MYYRVCPDCGAHLDAGEICGCAKKELSPTKDHSSKPYAILKESVSIVSQNRGKVNRKTEEIYGASLYAPRNCMAKEAESKADSRPETFYGRNI